MPAKSVDNFVNNTCTKQKRNTVRKPCRQREFPQATNSAPRNQALTLINYSPYLDICASA